MSGIEWVEVRAPSIEEATTVALEELGLASADAVEIEVLEEPSKGFLGMGAQDAVIRVKPKQGGGDRKQSRGRRRSGQGGKGSGNRQSGPKDGGKQPAKDRGPAQKKDSGQQRKKRTEQKPVAQNRPKDDDDRDEMSVEEQASELERFLTGLLAAFDLEGEVKTRVEDDAVFVDVVGEQTEALVGAKGSTLHAVLELCRTIIQRRVRRGARIRLDIAGYNERRREALQIYARRLGERVLAEGGEVMLEPMNSAERKVVHDTIAELDGVRSYSEGEEPRRSVVVSKDE